MLRNCFRLKAITWINQLIKFLRRIVKKNTKRQYPFPSHTYKISYWSEWGRKHLARSRPYALPCSLEEMRQGCSHPANLQTSTGSIDVIHKTIQSIQGMITF